ncbi:MAG: DUF5930 domain-containing protein [Mangrovicoccus sp.]
MHAGVFGHQTKKGLDVFGEKQIFLKSGDTTRFVRIRPRDQILALAVLTGLVAWAIAGTGIAISQHFAKSEITEAPVTEQVYLERIKALAEDRDQRSMEMAAAQTGYGDAMAELARLQDRVFEAELRATEHAQEAAALRDLLDSANRSRAAAETRLASLEGSEGSAGQLTGPVMGNSGTLQMVTRTLSDVTEERDALSADLSEAEGQIAELERQAYETTIRNDHLFGKLEKAVSVTMAPLDNVFRQVGMSSDSLINAMRSRYDGQGGPLTPISISTKGEQHPDTQRANNILAHMEELNLYRMAVDALPVALPVDSSVRRTSGFGYRRDPIRGGSRLHAGVDWAGAYGTAVKATADGVVVFAGWQSGYGRLVKIKHEFGIETRYAHLAKINVKVGQKVSRGKLIGAMGSSGRSTGTHLHYEVRVGGKATNPMTYIRAARNVF